MRGAQRAADVEAVHVRQSEVEDDELHVGPDQRRAAAVGALHLVSLAVEHAAEARGDRLVVLDHHDPWPAHGNDGIRAAPGRRSDSDLALTFPRPGAEPRVLRSRPCHASSRSPPWPPSSPVAVADRRSPSIRIPLRAARPATSPTTRRTSRYAPPNAGYSVKVPEGWARTSSGGAVTFTDKLNSIRMESARATSPPTVASVKSATLPQLAKSVKGFQPGGVTIVKRQVGPGRPGHVSLRRADECSDGPQRPGRRRAVPVLPHAAAP